MHENTILKQVQHVFLAGLGSSDDENSDVPPITVKLSSEHHTQGGSTHITNTHSEHRFLGHVSLTSALLGSVDDGSDWSTLTAESGEDTPSWPVAMETEESEVVRCVCEVDEENDFMIQVRATCSRLGYKSRKI